MMRIIATPMPWNYLAWNSVLSTLARSVGTATLSAERPPYELGHLAHRDVGEVRLQLEVPARKKIRGFYKWIWCFSASIKLNIIVFLSNTGNIPVLRDEHHVPPDDATLGGGGDLLEGAEVLAAVEDEVVVLLVICYGWRGSRCLHSSCRKGYHLKEYVNMNITDTRDAR